MDIEKHLLSIQKTLSEITKALQIRVPETEYLNYQQAMAYTDRKRSWLQRRLAYEVGEGFGKQLVKDVDWVRRGNKVYFKKTSLERLISELQN